MITLLRQERMLMLMMMFLCADADDDVFLC
jgi:hypothetical protein